MGFQAGFLGRDVPGVGGETGRVLFPHFPLRVNLLHVGGRGVPLAAILAGGAIHGGVCSTSVWAAGVCLPDAHPH